jgi:hypothetical protein
LLLLFVPCAILAGEKPLPLLTGNAKIDFFGDRLSPPPLMLLQDTTSTYLDHSAAAKEKSPWLAGALSLAIPGAGEVYSQQYIKGAAFFALEAVSWFLVYKYNKEGDKQTQAYEDYANAHWSATRYTEWTLDNIGVLSSGTLTRQQYESRVFTADYDPNGPNPPPFKDLDWNELNLMEDDIGLAAPPGGNGYTHRLPDYGVQQYYELIGKYPEFSRGWDDNPAFGTSGYLIQSTDLPMKNVSARFNEYQLARAEANHQYDVASTWMSVVIVNHVLSALDAYWSATTYNKTLRAEAHMNLIPTNYGMVPYTELKLAYAF